MDTEKHHNMQKPPGEHDKPNKANCAKWSGRTKDHIQSKGQGGIELVSAVMWTVSFGRHARVTDAMIEQRCGRIFQTSNIEQLHLLMDSWTDRTADKAISCRGESYTTNSCPKPSTNNSC